MKKGMNKWAASRTNNQSDAVSNLTLQQMTEECAAELEYANDRLSVGRTLTQKPWAALSRALLARAAASYWAKQAMGALLALQSWTETNESVIGLTVQQLLQSYPTGLMPLTVLTDMLITLDNWLTVMENNM